MEIRILIRATEPLTGTAMTEGEEPLDFTGWLELLKTLSALIGAEEHLTGEEPVPSRGLMRGEEPVSGHADDKAVDNGALQV